jgi:segregation and condensation protein B
MAPLNLRSAVEALLFSSDQPLTLTMLADALEAAPEAVTESLRALADDYRARDAGVEVREMAGGWIVTTTAEQHEWVARMLRGKRRMRLSRAALETLAIIAYKQPVTKSEIEAIRGVDSSGTLATLLERSLVTIKGRSTVVGRPLLYGSTPEFLNYFGLKELSELPRPEELRALVAAREPEQLEMLELDGDGMPLALVAAGAEVLAAAEDGAAEPASAAVAGTHARGAAGSEADDATAASAFLVSGDALAASDEMASDEAGDEAEDEEDEYDDDDEDDEDDDEDEADEDDDGGDDGRPSATLRDRGGR